MTDSPIPFSLDPDRYEPDNDGYLREIVGPWALDKHARLEKYVGISRAVRAKFVGEGKAGATYIDLFCGPGKSRVRDETTVIDGSPVVVWNESMRGQAPFTQVHIADAEHVLVEAAEFRLRKLGAPVLSDIGKAADTVDRILGKLDPYALHFAFLDPYNLGALPFDILRKLAAIERMDILMHVSIQDLQRNLSTYMAQDNSPLDAFAPGWRKQVGQTQDQHLIRGKILEHWRGLLHAEGMKTAETHELVTGSNNQRLYWLAFAARHERALEFWEKIRNLGPDKQLTLL